MVIAAEQRNTLLPDVPSTTSRFTALFAITALAAAKYSPSNDNSAPGESLRVRELLLKIQNMTFAPHSRRSTVVIADHTQIAVLAGQETGQHVLRFIRILILIDMDMAKTSAESRQYARIFRTSVPAASANRQIYGVILTKRHFQIYFRIQMSLRRRSFSAIWPPYRHRAGDSCRLMKSVTCRERFRSGDSLLRILRTVLCASSASRIVKSGGSRLSRVQAQNPRHHQWKNRPTCRPPDRRLDSRCARAFRAPPCS